MNHHVLEKEEQLADEASCSSSLLPSLSSLSVENNTFTNREIIVGPIYMGRKIVNIANSIDEKLRNGEKFFSLELFSSKKYNEEIYERFISEISLCSAVPPLFYSTTCHEKISNNRYLEIFKKFPNNTLLHVAGNDLKVKDVENILNDALAQGKINIFALRGDNCTGNGDFRHAVDLVKFARINYENKFVICVAGFPQMHPESLSKKMEMMYMKEKVNAGANFIITQIFFESRVFVDYVKDCRRYDINVPVIAGIFPITSYESLVRMSKLCSFEIPRFILNDIEPIKDSDEKVYAYGIAMARKLIEEIFQSKAASGFHLFTLNRASVALDVCRKMFD